MGFFLSDAYFLIMTSSKNTATPTVLNINTIPLALYSPHNTRKNRTIKAPNILNCLVVIVPTPIRFQET